MCTKALLFAALVAALGTGAQAGQYADAMAQCILTNTSASDRDTLTQWAYVTLGKTDAAKKVQAIPAAKTKAVEDKAKKLVTNLTTGACAKPFAQLMIKEPKTGLQNTAVALAQELLTEEIKSKTLNLLPTVNIGNVSRETVEQIGGLITNLLKK